MGEGVEAVLGPTNTGKTHYAIERMLSHSGGIIGFPLRLLAREVYDRVVEKRGKGSAALLTGEEKITPPTAQYFLCTVEAMPLDWGSDFIAVDEIQLCADPDRGYVFTDRLLRARGRRETLFLGSDTMRGRISALLPKAKITTRPRLSTLAYTGSKKIARLPGRSAVVAFSTDQVYSIAELLRRMKGGAAVVMGALSPRTRNAQVEIYQNGDVEHLVATDAIGMGLNLDLQHVAFAGLGKFDGRRSRGLTPSEIAQIAGRAGRHTADGTFGVTGDAAPLSDELALNIVQHRFEPVRHLEWRNARLEFGTVPALLRSLEVQAPAQGLRRARDADDLIALRTLWNDPTIEDIAQGGAAVRRLWDCCQIPDFRKVSHSEHAALVAKIFRFLISPDGAIPSDWIAGEVRRLDKTEGDIDTLSRRLAYVRTWTYVANRNGWLEDAGHWRGETRAIEDRLSDALHQRLTQRFVDRRTSVLMRRLKQKEGLVAEVSDTGDVTAEGEHLGRIDGFRFIADETATSDERQKLRAASLGALKSWFAHRADKFYNAPDTEIDVTEQGGLMWGEVAVGRLETGADALSPKIRAFVDEMLDPPVVEKIERRLSHWINRRIAALFEPLIALKDDEAVTGLARGVGFQLVEALGVLERRPIAEDIKSLDQEARTLLRKHGVRFGQHSVFMPALLKPAPTRLRLVLWGLAAKLDEIPGAPPPGHVTVPAAGEEPEGFWLCVGYRKAGARAIRIDMLERLADLLRDQDGRGGFEASADMLSITGLTLDQFADLMGGLGYDAKRGERPKAARPAPEAKPGGADEAAAATGAEESSATTAEAAPGDPPAAQEDVSAEAAGEAVVEAPSADVAAPSKAEGPPTEPSPDGAADEMAPAADSNEETPSEVASEPAASVADEDGAEKEAATPDEAAELEVFYTFTFARKPRRLGRTHGNRRQGDGQRQPRGEGGFKKDGKPGGFKKGKRPPRGKGKPEDRPRPHAASSKPQRGPDPDSPFAVLQKLKDQ